MALTLSSSLALAAAKFAVCEPPHEVVGGEVRGKCYHIHVHTCIGVCVRVCVCKGVWYGMYRVLNGIVCVFTKY